MTTPLEQAQRQLDAATATHASHAASLANAVDRWFASGLDSHGRTASTFLEQWRRSRDAVGEAQAAVDLLAVCPGCGETGCSGLARDCDDHLTGDDERADRLAQRAA